MNAWPIAVGVGGEIQSCTSSGGSVNNSPIVTPRGLRAVGRSAISTRSGTRTVRDQYDTLSIWNGNQPGSSMISTGMTGTARHGTSPHSASMIRVNTFDWRAPPRARINSRARAICGASTGSPAAFSAKYALTEALMSGAPP